MSEAKAEAIKSWKTPAGELLRQLSGADGEPWFVAKDACEALGLSDVSKACSRLDTDEKGTNLIRTPGGEQKLLVIAESGLYKLIVRSDKPEAKAFLRWVTRDVLPSIRKTGSYDVRQSAHGPVPPLLRDMVRQEQADEYGVMWPSEFPQHMCKLYRKPYPGRQPQWMAMVYRRLYNLVAGSPAMREIKLRNPEPRHGKNHHQWFTPKARDAMSRQVGVAQGIDLNAAVKASTRELRAIHEALGKRYVGKNAVITSDYNGQLFGSSRKSLKGQTVTIERVCFDECGVCFFVKGQLVSLRPDELEVPS